jgi:adenine-specific DNA methylase
MFPALMPDALSKASHITGIELDPVTTRIVRLLQPRARIVCGDFARTDLPDHFDLAIGNPPFSDRSAKSIRLYTSRRPFSLEPFVSQSRFKLYCLGFYAFVVDVLGILPKTGDRLRKTFEPAKRNIHHCNRAGLQPGVAVREGFRKGSEIRTLVDEFFAAPPSP